MEVQKFYYDNRVVNAFVIATVIWGVIGFTLGLTVASLLVWPEIPEMIFGTDEFSGLFGNTPQALAESKNVTYLGCNFRFRWK